MPIDPSMLAKTIGTLPDLDPRRDLAATLRQAVIAAKQLFDVDAAGSCWPTPTGSCPGQRLRPAGQAVEDTSSSSARAPAWTPPPRPGRRPCPTATADPRGEATLVLADLEVRAGLSVPVELGGGPIGSLDVYATSPRAWDDSEVSALPADAGWWPACSERRPRPSQRACWPTSSRWPWTPGVLIERAKGALMERERLEDQEAFTHLRRAARSSGRKLSEVAREVADGQPLPAADHPTEPHHAPASTPSWPQPARNLGGERRRCRPGCRGTVDTVEDRPSSALVSRRCQKPAEPGRPWPTASPGGGTYLDEPAPGSLAELVAGTPSQAGTDPGGQAPQWLFAFDAAGMAAFRALALLATHQTHTAQVRAQLTGWDWATLEDATWPCW